MTREFDARDARAADVVDAPNRDRQPRTGRCKVGEFGPHPELDALACGKVRIGLAQGNGHAAHVSLRALDAAGLLKTFLSAPADLSPADCAIAIAEEGWIAGVGHEHLRLALLEAA